MRCRHARGQPPRGYLFKTEAATRYYEDHGYPRYTPLSTDPPYRTEFRIHVEPFFTSSRIRAWEPDLRELIENLSGNLDTEEPVDFVKAFCFPLPMSDMTIILGLPLEDHGLLKHWTNVFEEGPDGKGKTRGDTEIVPEAMEMDVQSAMNAWPTGAISIEYD